ncbi:hypothetical protein V1478_008768 [Vespula squamosa]|uniref:Uncharacterized protein n=1 Tax=Vespula squamosa TaxID=30214 RepID=A0ABD2AWF8_VESSQ
MSINAADLANTLADQSQRVSSHKNLEFEATLCSISYGVEGVEPDANKRDYPVTSDQMWWCARDSGEE